MKTKDLRKIVKEVLNEIDEKGKFWDDGGGELYTILRKLKKAGYSEEYIIKYVKETFNPISSPSWSDPNSPFYRGGD
mgnify:CR=1 FL=1